MMMFAGRKQRRVKKIYGEGLKYQFPIFLLRTAEEKGKIHLG